MKKTKCGNILLDRKDQKLLDVVLERYDDVYDEGDQNDKYDKLAIDLRKLIKEKPKKNKKE